MPDKIRAAGAYLILRSGSRWSDVFRLSPPATAVIGRSSSNQIVLGSEQASRRHASVVWSDSGWTIQDHGSRNGTRLNGQRIEAAKTLADGDTIEIAGFAIQFTHKIDIPAAQSLIPGSWLTKPPTIK